MHYMTQYTHYLSNNSVTTPLLMSEPRQLRCPGQGIMKLSLPHMQILSVHV